MNPIYTFAVDERASLEDSLVELQANPYKDYDDFSAAIRGLIERGAVPASFVTACSRIKDQRSRAETYAHLLSNCPLDYDIPLFDQDNPVQDKYAQKSTYAGEGMLELLAQLTGTPLLAYATRNNGDFFHDVYADNRYRRTQTQKTDGELFWHNDRTAHPVRADYLALLGMRCPTDDLVYTGYIDGRELLRHLPADSQALLRRAEFVTPFDEYSRDANQRQVISEPHEVLENEHSFRYYDTRTRPADTTSAPHFAVLMELRDALARTEEQYHRIQYRDLLVIANQDGLHCRKMVDIRHPETTRQRWLLKTYAFRNEQAASAHVDAHVDAWLGGVRVAD